MQLSRVWLHNYRCFRDIDVRLAPGTVLIGANNVGKTTLLDAIADLYAARETEWTNVVNEDVADLSHKKSAVAVVGEFELVTQRERDAWKPLTGTDQVILGRVWRDSRVSKATFVIVRNDIHARLIASAAERDSDLDGYVQGQQFRWFGDYQWLRFDEFLRAAEAEVINLDPVAIVETWPGPEAVVRIPGIEQALPTVADVVRPILIERAASHLRTIAPEDEPILEARPDGTEEYVWPEEREEPPRHPVSQLDWSIARAKADVGKGLESSLPRYLPDVSGAALRQIYVAGPNASKQTLALLIGDIQAFVVRNDANVLVEELGAGARRSAAIAALDLYRNPDLWPPESNIVLLIEEPEAGLHPGAQRQLAAALHDLPTYGVQVILVTHSPVVLRAADWSGVRLVRSNLDSDGTWHHDVVLPDRLAEIARELGTEPADILLANRFLIVEGPGDCAVLDAWAHVLGVDFRGAGLQLVPAGGHGWVSVVTTFLELAYQGAQLMVLLDNGKATEKTRLELEKKHDSLKVQLFSMTEIEACFAPDAVAAWLIERGAERESVDAWRSESRGELRKEALRGLAERLISRDYKYDVVLDGSAIARLTRERDIPEEIKRVIFGALS